MRTCQEFIQHRLNTCISLYVRVKDKLNQFDTQFPVYILDLASYNLGKVRLEPECSKWFFQGIAGLLCFTTPHVHVQFHQLISADHLQCVLVNLCRFLLLLLPPPWFAGFLVSTYLPGKLFPLVPFSVTVPVFSCFQGWLPWISPSAYGFLLPINP